MKTTMPDFSAETHNCSGADLGDFFKGQGSMYLEAREVCDSCPLSDACFSYALSNDIAGFWGGTSEADRKKIRALLDLNPIPVNSSLTLLGIFQGANMAREARARDIGEHSTRLWEALDEQEAYDARDLVLEEYAERRQRAIEHTRANGHKCRSGRFFTEDQVRRIRASEESNRVLADRYQVATETIRKIRSRLRYADVSDEAA